MSWRHWISVAILALIAHGAVADDAESLIRYRQSVMESVGGHMKALSTIMRGNVFSEDLAYHAGALADISAVVARVFPAGSGAGKTDALAAIWEKPDEFKLRVEAFQKAARGLADAAKGGDQRAIGGAMRELGGSCKGCHDDFRAE